MKKDTFFSIVMPVYNDEKNVGNAIESIINQSYKNWELIIVDDGSTDRSYEIANNYAKKDKRIKVYKMEKNIGAPSCMNFGTSKSKYNWVAIIDSDAIEPKEWLKIANNLATNKIDLFEGTIKYKKTEKLSYLQNVFYYIENRLFEKEETLYNLDNFSRPPVAGANFFYTKKVFNKLGGFDVKIKAGYDSLFICQAIENGFNVLYSPKMFVNHPLYNWENLSDFFKRGIKFTKWSNLSSKKSKLIKKPYLTAVKLLITIFISFLISVFVFGIKNTLLILFLMLILFLIYRFIDLNKNIPKKYIPVYIFLDLIKKVIGIFIYILNLKPKSPYWKIKNKK